MNYFPSQLLTSHSVCVTATHELAINLCSHNKIIQSNAISSFDVDSVPFCICSYVTQGLTSFKSDFIPGFLQYVEHESTETTAGTTSIIAEGLVRHTLLTDDGHLHTITTTMSYDPTNQY